MQDENRGNKNLMEIVEDRGVIVRYRNIYDGYMVGDKFRNDEIHNEETEEYHGYTNKEEYLMYNDYEYDEKMDY